MEKTMHWEIMKEKKKKRRRRRRIRRLFFLLILMGFMTMTDPGRSIVSRVSKVEAGEVKDFLARLGEVILSAAPSLRDWIANKLTYFAQFM